MVNDSQPNISNEGSKITSGIFWQLGERFLARGVEFIVSLVLARLLEPKDYGTVAIVLVFISLADVFVFSGFSTALIQKKDANNTDFSTIFYCSLISSFLFYFILFFSAPLIAEYYNNSDLVLIVRVFSLKIPLSVYNSIQHAYVSRHMLFKCFFWSTMIGTLVSCVVGIVLALYGFGVWALIAQYFTNTIIDTLVLSFTVKWHPSLCFSVKSAKTLMKYGWKILCADLSGTFFYQIRNFIIGKKYSSEDLAFYTKGLQLPQMLYTNIGNSINAVLFPAMSNHSDSIQTVRDMTRQTLKKSAFILFPVLLGLAAVMKPLVVVLYTEKWINSVLYAQIICIGYAIAVIGQSSFQALKAIGKSDVVLKLEFIKKPVYILLLLYGAKRSVVLVCLFSTIYELYGVTINSIYVKRFIHYSLVEQLLDISKTIISSILMMVFVALIPNIISPLITLMIKICSGVIIYYVMSILLKNEDLRVFILKLKEIKRNVTKKV